AAAAAAAFVACRSGRGRGRAAHCSAAAVQERVRQERARQYHLLLLNDPVNKREYVSRCLMLVCSLAERDAYRTMMTAHTEGSAVVGTYSFELADLYCGSLKEKNISADIIPVDDGD
ncbi:unnamed protein product, partial [Prorocentrum cordatum]